MQVIKYVFQPHGDDRGQLVALEEFKDIPFRVKRVYYMYDTAKGVTRGYHAHKSLQQILVCIHGSCKIRLDNGREKKVIPLDGYDDVFIHGDEFGFAVIDANGKQISYTIREIAEILNKYGKFENDSIRLCSCRTGANSGAAAQGLANLTVKNVLAPTKDLWIKQEDDKGICEKEIKHMVNGNCLFQRGDLYEVNTTL